MEIVLARHGKPIWSDTTSIAGHEVGEWVRRYDRAGITREVAPPERVRRLALSVGCVAASDLRRSIESAAWLVSADNVRIEPELREACLPESIGVSIRLPPGVWVALARAAWWLDWCRSPETVATTRERAGRAAGRLSALAREYGSVLVVGHGMFNRFIAAYLRTQRWRGPRAMPAAYWATATFVRTE